MTKHGGTAKVNLFLITTGRSQLPTSAEEGQTSAHLALWDCSVQESRVCRNNTIQEAEPRTLAPPTLILRSHREHREPGLTSHHRLTASLAEAMQQPALSAPSWHLQRRPPPPNHKPQAYLPSLGLQGVTRFP